MERLGLLQECDDGGHDVFYDWDDGDDEKRITFSACRKSRPAGDVKIFVPSKKWISSPPLCCAGLWLMGIDGD